MRYDLRKLFIATPSIATRFSRLKNALNNRLISYCIRNMSCNARVKTTMAIMNYNLPTSLFVEREIFLKLVVKMAGVVVHMIHDARSHRLAIAATERNVIRLVITVN